MIHHFDIGHLRPENDSYIELEHRFESGEVKITRVTLADMEYGFHLKDTEGNYVLGRRMEQMLLAKELVELRVHDSVHSSGEFKFLYRGFYTKGRYV